MREANGSLRFENQKLKASLEEALKGMVNQFDACDAYRKRAETAEYKLDRCRRALELAEGRLALLLISYPDASEVNDHPSATRYVLAKVREALNVEINADDR